jgi:hypothetical protein
MIMASRMFDLGTGQGVSNLGISVHADPVYSSDLTIEPGFSHKLEQIEKAAIPIYDSALPHIIPARDFLEFTYQTKMHWSEETAKILFGEIEYAEAIRKGLFRRLLERLQGWKEIDMREFVRSVPLIELHRPKISGCKTSFSLTYEHETDYAFTIKVFGFGGGASASKSFGRTIKITINDQCASYHVPVKFRVRVFELKGSTRYEIEPVDILDDHNVIAITAEEERCGMHDDRINACGYETRVFSQQVGGFFNEKVHFDAGRKVQWSWGPKLVVAGLEIEEGIQGVVQSLKKIIYEYDLVGGHLYTAYCAPSALSYCWNWDEIQK